MIKFEHIDAKTVDEAVSALSSGDAMVMAGGTDLLTMLKNFVSPNVEPAKIVNLKTIPGLSGISESGGMLTIGALTTLAEIANSPVVQGSYAALAQAARKVASPEIRNMGTIGGNLVQMNRCWYYRCDYNYFDCLRKNPSGVCQATLGNNRNHSIFGALEGCVAVNPSDTAPALVALDGQVVTTKRTIAVEDLFTVDLDKTTVLDDDEIITEIQVPTPASGTKSTFLKFAIRKAIDFALVSVAVARDGASGKICLGGVANKPRRATDAEAALPDAEAAGAAAVTGANALPYNGYKLQIVKVMVKRAVEATA
jgi:xanthine dehydrogenase YagS FAD-binding subunit